MDRQKAHIHILWALIALTCIFFAVAVPPLQKPDEESHFMRTLAIARGLTVCTSSRDHTIRLNKDVAEMISDVKRLQLPNHPERKFDLSLYRKPLTTDSAMVPYTIKRIYCGFPTLPYLPLVAGYLIGEALHLNAYLIFALGRLVLTAFGLGWMALLYRRTPPGYKTILLFVFAIPMFLHQLGAFSYDGVHILLACTLFVMIVSGKPKRLLPWLGTTMVALLLSKSGGYELVPLLYFILPRAQIVPTGIGYGKRTLIFFTSIAAGVGIGKWTELKGMAAGATLNAGVNPAHQIGYIVSHPAGYVLMIAKTTYHFSVFYVQSMLGILGWLEYGFPHIIYILYGLIMLYVVFSGRLPEHSLLSRKRLIILFGILVASYLYILTIFYVLWSRVGSSLADGVQGRYFLALLQFSVFALLQARVRWIRPLRLPEMSPWVYACLFVLMDGVIMYSVISRYYL